MSNPIQKSLACTALAFVVMASQQSQAAVMGAQIFVQNSGNVIATFEGQTAGYDNELFLNTPGNSFGRIFHNHLNSPGDTFDLGYFAAGTELSFRLHVVNTGYDFYTGDGSSNPDLIPHAMVDVQPTKTVVGFEDLFDGGDRDFDDTLFSFTNTGIHRVPDASSTLPLLGSAMAGIAAIRRRLKI